MNGNSYPYQQPQAQYVQPQQYPPYYQQQYGPNPYIQPQQQPQEERAVFTQLLTDAEVAKLKKNPVTPFNYKLNEKESLKAICTHKENGSAGPNLIRLPDGRYRCPICQEEFNLINPDANIEEIKSIISNFNDLMQSIKVYYGNPPMALREFFVFIGFIL